MATTISTQDIVDAKRDIDDIGKAVNEKVIVSPRYGEDFRSLPMIADEGQAIINSLDSAAQGKINEWDAAVDLITQQGGVPALAVSTASGETQQGINDYNGAKWRNKAGGYDLNARVMLDNGDIVKSTVAGNTVNPNVDMAGWDNLTQKSQEVIEYVTPRLSADYILVSGENNPTLDNISIQSALTLSGITGQDIKGVGKFRITETFNFRGVRVDFTSANIELMNDSAMVRIGGSSASTVNRLQQFAWVYRTSGQPKTIPSIRVEGTKDQFIHVGNCDYMQLYADTTAANVDGSIAYCTFNLGKIDKLEITNNPNNTIPDSGGNGGAVQWINENHFDIQRCSNFIMSGTYHHNHNHFYGGVFEGASSINFLTGRDNYFHNLRFEGSSATVEFAADTERNTVLNTWDSSIGFPIAIPNVTDNGFDNNVIDDFFTLKSSVITAYTDISKPVVNNLVNSLRAPQLQRLVAVSANSSLAASEMIPAIFNDWYRWISLSNNDTNDVNARYRAKIEFYDSKLNPVTANANFIYTTGRVMSSVSGNSITSSGNVNAAYAALLQPALTAGVRFIKVKWLSNSPVTAAVSNAQALYVTRHSKLGIPFMSSFGVERPNRDWIFTAKPTQGFVPVGVSGFKSDGTEQYVCTFALETSISSLSGASLEVASVTGVQVGDIVGINLDDLTTHWTTVSAVSWSTITLSDGAPSAASSGSRVVFNRWVTK